MGDSALWLHIFRGACRGECILGRVWRHDRENTDDKAWPRNHAYMLRDYRVLYEEYRSYLRLDLHYRAPFVLAAFPRIHLRARNYIGAKSKHRRFLLQLVRCNSDDPVLNLLDVRVEELGLSAFSFHSSDICFFHIILCDS